MKPAKIIAVIALVLGGVVVGYYAAVSRAPPPEPQPVVVEPDTPTPQRVQTAPEPSPPPERAPARYHGPTRAIVLGGGEARVQFQDDRLEKKNTAAGLDDGGPDFYWKLALPASIGNDDAAVALWEALEKCKLVPRTEADLEAAKKAAYEAFSRDPTKGDVERGIDYWQRGYERCKETDDDMWVEAELLLGEAADRGSVAAKFAYASAIWQSNREDALRRLDELWDDGYFLALPPLAGRGGSR
jgi:hypothetical protein